MPTVRVALAAVIGLGFALVVAVQANQPTPNWDANKLVGELADETVGTWIGFRTEASDTDAGGPSLESAVRAAVDSLEFGEVEPTAAVEDLLCVLEAWRSEKTTELLERRSSVGLVMDQEMARTGLRGLAGWGWLPPDRVGAIETAKDGEIMDLLMEAQRGSGFGIDLVDVDGVEAGFGVTTAMRSAEWPPSGMMMFPCVFNAPGGMPADVEALEDTPATFHVRLRVRFAGSGLGIVRFGYVYSAADDLWIPVGAAYSRFERADRIMACLVN